MFEVLPEFEHLFLDLIDLLVLSSLPPCLTFFDGGEI